MGLAFFKKLYIYIYIVLEGSWKMGLTISRNSVSLSLYIYIDTVHYIISIVKDLHCGCDPTDGTMSCSIHDLIVKLLCVYIIACGSISSITYLLFTFLFI